MTEPRTQGDYGARGVEAAKRVLVDLGQVLGTYFQDSIVVVGGWVPELLIADAEEPHVGSIDVDLALDPDKLREGRYAEIVKALLSTRRYQQTQLPFKLRALVDLDDGEPAIAVDVDFLKPLERRKRKGHRLLPGFRPLDADGCAAAFRDPKVVPLAGLSISGAENRVTVLVAAIEDFLVMKAHALAGRDKPKDAYDICYCLDNASEGMDSLAASWRSRRAQPLVAKAIEHLRAKFGSVASYGPQQVAIFREGGSREDREQIARRAYELVVRFLELVDAQQSQR